MIKFLVKDLVVRDTSKKKTTVWYKPTTNPKALNKDRQYPHMSLQVLFICF